MSVFVIESQIGSSPTLTAGTVALRVGSMETIVPVEPMSGLRSATDRSAPSSIVTPSLITPVGVTSILRPPLVSVGIVPGVVSLKATNLLNSTFPADAAGISRSPCLQPQSRHAWRFLLRSKPLPEPQVR